MSNIYIGIFKSIAPALIAVLRTEAKKSDNTIDDSLVNVLENILKEFKIL